MQVQALGAVEQAQRQAAWALVAGVEAQARTQAVRAGESAVQVRAQQGHWVRHPAQAQAAGWPAVEDDAAEWVEAAGQIVESAGERPA